MRATHWDPALTSQQMQRNTVQWVTSCAVSHGQKHLYMTIFHEIQQELPTNSLEVKFIHSCQFSIRTISIFFEVLYSMPIYSITEDVVTTSKTSLVKCLSLVSGSALLRCKQSILHIKHYHEANQCCLEKHASSALVLCRRIQCVSCSVTHLWLNARSNEFLKFRRFNTELIFVIVPERQMTTYAVNWVS